MSKALIIIDMWDKYHPGHDRFTSSLEQLSLRLNDLIKRTSLSIVVASHNTSNSGRDFRSLKDFGTPWSTTNQTILQGLHDHTGDNLVSWDRDEVMKFLNLHKVQDLYFAGVSFPGCIQHRPLGMLKMQNSFNCHVVIDCVLNTLGPKYTEYDIIHDTYHTVLISGLSYIHSSELHKIT